MSKINLRNCSDLLYNKISSLSTLINQINHNKLIITDIFDILDLILSFWEFQISYPHLYYLP